MTASIGTVDFAIRTAALYHDGQTDRSGQPYIYHVLRVGMMGKTVEEQIVGILHDILEDTHYRYDDLKKFFGTQVAEAVFALTRTETVYEDFIIRIKKNPLATAVKLNDLKDNTDPKRAGGSTPRLLGRYHKAIAYLKGTTDEEIKAWRPPVASGNRRVSSDNL